MDTGSVSQAGSSEASNRSTYQNSPSATTSTVLRTSGKVNDNSNASSLNAQGDGSLVEKLKKHYRTSPTGIKAKRFSFIFFHFQSISQLYMFLTQIIPSVLHDCDPMTQYYTKMIPVYLFVMSQANWWCTILYSSDLPDVRDKPALDDGDWFQRAPEILKNAEKIEPKIDKYGFEWKYCEPCDRYKPPRSHHCKICKRCILRRDHHCYFTGCCIGHYNQRYFAVMCFWGVATSVISFPSSLAYLYTLQDETWWGDYFLPYTLFCCFCCGNLSWQFTLLIFQLYAIVFFFVAGGLYFTLQISLITSGKTLVELAKKFDMKVTSDWRENIRVVFGDYWFVNFLFPAQIIFKQRHDGVHYEGVKFFGKREDND